MVKCAVDKCNKGINKRCPGLQCAKCNKWWHATCVSITNEQLTALHATESVDWKCKSCAGSAKPKRVSYILPEENDENDDCPIIEDTSLNKKALIKELLNDMRAEITIIIQTELQKSLGFYSDKIDEYGQKIKVYEQSMSSLENQCTELKNTVKNLQLKYDTTMEIRCNQLEQFQVSNQLEICGVGETEQENVVDLAKKVATVLNRNPDEVVKAYRKTIRAPGGQKKNNEPAPLIVTLREGNRDTWLESAKKCTIMAAELGGTDVNSKIYLRESLIPTTAHLLWKTKEELAGLYKYIWCKNGNVLIRKENEKVVSVRSLQHLQKIKNEELNKNKNGK
ncbi:hypothetical protein NE865_10842 [Phthorimaea operculella]|nr:hypothetical protein NE865_10842 [Phthorimaea operculella]